jgi:AcrR family transcriptional regulator
MAAPHRSAPAGGDAPAGAPRARKSAEERREEILAIAVRQFAEGGYRGTSTEAIAREAGISQPYLFRLFRTKRELFLACSDRACAHVREVFGRVAAEAPAGERLDRMGAAYIDELLPERHEILMLMQSYVAGADPEIQGHVRRAYMELVREVAELAGVPPADTYTFFAKGMLLNVIAALDIPVEDGIESWGSH